MQATDRVRSPAQVKPIEEAITQVDAELREIIVNALSIRTRSYSSFQAKETGNAYQAVRLRDEILSGFRVSDEEVWAGLNVRGHTVIDLGCNLGERTRLAVRAGASFAEGVEYEELFVRIGGLINVYNRMHNILLRQGDVTQSGCLDKNYDIVACFSAFVYVKERLEEILGKCQKLFVLETHALAKNWFDRYIALGAKHLPYWVIYGFADHGARLTAQKRALAAFGRDAESVASIAGERARSLGERNWNLASVRVDSPRIVDLCGERQRGTKQLFAEFREMFKSRQQPSAAEIIDALDVLANDIEHHAGEMKDDQFRSDQYWVKLFSGMAEYVRQGQVSTENSYVQFLRQLTADGKYDPGMKSVLEDSERAAARLKLRFDAFLTVLQTKKVTGPPVLVYNALSVSALTVEGFSEADYHPAHFFIDAQQRRYLAPIIDGYHRLAALYMSGAEEIKCMFVWSNIHPINQSRAMMSAGHAGNPDWSDKRVGRMVENTVAELFDGK